MDNRTVETLQAWGFEDCIETFKSDGYDFESFLCISRESAKEIITKRAKLDLFFRKLKVLQEHEQKKDINTNNSNEQSDRVNFLDNREDKIRAVIEEESLHENPDCIVEPEKASENIQQVPVLNLAGSSRASHENLPNNEKSDKRTLEDGDDTFCNKRIKNGASEVVCAVLTGSYGDSVKKEAAASPLSKATRKALALAIIKKELNDCNQKIHKHRFIELAEGITIELPKEKASIYYTPYVKSKETGKKIYPKGKLYEAYKSFTAKLRGQKLRNSNRTDQGHTADKNAISYHEDDDIKYLYEIGEDVPIVKEKWERTYEKRQKIFQGLKRSSDIIKKFKCLRNPTGYQYLLLDFDKKYHHQSDNLIFGWKEFGAKIQKKLNITIPPGATESALQAEVFTSIGKLFSPFTLNFAKRKVWRVTKQEIQDGFLAHVKNNDDIYEYLERQRNKLLEYKLTLQPFVIIVGADLSNITDSYVIVDDKHFRFESIVRAIDVCFKINFALNTEYQAQSKSAWLFLQQAIYKIKLKYDIDPRVDQLLDDFNY